MNRLGYAIVVDTSVARAAGTAQNSISICCRETLDTLDKAGHRLAMSDPLWGEWDKRVLGRRERHWDRYASLYTMRWFVLMKSRGRVVWVQLPLDPSFQKRVIEAVKEVHSQMVERVKKDIHLVETALATDNRIVALDAYARIDFRELAKKLIELRDILWLNPNEDDVPVWLRAGAPDEPSVRLYQA